MALTKWDERLREIVTGETASKIVNLDAYRSA
jgi:hypothetical protein